MSIGHNEASQARIEKNKHGRTVKEKKSTHSIIFTLATMALHADHESAFDAHVDFADLKDKVVIEHVELVATPKPPVADDFMYEFKYNHALPTTSVLGVDIPADCDAQKEAGTIVARLSEAMGNGDAQAFTDLFLENGEFQTPEHPLDRPDSVQVSGATNCPSPGTTAPSTFNRLF